MKNSCPVCGSGKVECSYPPEYEYNGCGISGVILIGRGVRRTACPDCGSQTTRIAHEQQLLQLIGLAILLDNKDLRGEDLRYLRTLFGMTQKELADKLVSGGRRETVAEWEKKRKVFETKFDEMARRIVLLHLFRTEVLESDHCLLDDNHRGRVLEYSSRLVDDILELVKPMRKPRQAVFLKHRPRLREWDFSIAS